MTPLHPNAAIGVVATLGLLVAGPVTVPVTIAPASTTPDDAVVAAYLATDVGTFGGPHAEVNGPAIQITADGTVLGTADTDVSDEDSPDDGCLYCGPFIAHAFAWHQGSLHDLGALPGNNSSGVFEMSRSGLGAGTSEVTGVDPLTGVVAQHAVTFRKGRVADLGTLPGGYESFAIAVNDRNQVAGLSSNDVPAPDFPNFFSWGTQVRTAVWRQGRIHDIGTLGGGDAVLATQNAEGEIAGDSYLDDTPNPDTGIPTLHSFLWTRGRMRDLGSLGGTQTFTTWLNNRGQVTGQSSLAGEEEYRPFFWTGHRMRDLGSLGGNYGLAWQVNGRGHVTGWSTPPGDETIHAFLWRGGQLTQLDKGTGSGCTYPESINNLDQVVGGTCDGTALLWREGRQYDLNTLVAPSDVHLTAATWIDDDGRIVALGELPSGDQHVFALTPTGAALDAPSAVAQTHAVGGPCRIPLGRVTPRAVLPPALAAQC